MNHALSEAALPQGFRFSATACGLKKTGALDLAVISSDVPASAAAVFTQNLVVAAPVLISKENMRASKGRMRAVVVNAGNANCATGEAGHAAHELDGAAMPPGPVGVGPGGLGPATIREIAEHDDSAALPGDGDRRGRVRDRNE